MTLPSEVGTEKRLRNPAMLTIIFLTIIFNSKAPSDRRFAGAVGCRALARWTSTMSSARQIIDGPLTGGSRAQVPQPGLRPANSKVIEMAPARSLGGATRSVGEP